MRLCKTTRGFTVIEVLAATAIMALMLTCVVSMLIGAMRSCDADLAQVNTDTNAVTAMGYMVNDIREAKKVDPLSGGVRLCVTLPVMTAGGYYDRTQADTAHQINYYVSDSTGVIGRIGTILWRSQNGVLRRIRDDVDYLMFVSDSPSQVRITIRTKDQIYGGTRQTDLTQRVVYLRNN